MDVADRLQREPPHSQFLAPRPRPRRRLHGRTHAGSASKSRTNRSKQPELFPSDPPSLAGSGPPLATAPLPAPAPLKLARALTIDGDIERPRALRPGGPAPAGSRVGRVIMFKGALLRERDLKVWRGGGWHGARGVVSKNGLLFFFCESLGRERGAVDAEVKTRQGNLACS